MISRKVQALLDFVDFLSVNKETFSDKNEIYNEELKIFQQKNELYPLNNIRKKKESDRLQHELDEKYNTIRQKVIEPIRNKAFELGICDSNPVSIYNWNVDEMPNPYDCKGFEIEDTDLINESKEKYRDFKRETKHFKCKQDYFFNNLDEILNMLFDYFSEENESQISKSKDIEEVNNVNRKDYDHLEILLPQQTNTTENEILKIGNITFTEFSNTKEALDYLKSYELKEVNKGQKNWLFDSIDLLLFEQEFNVYLESELKVEVDETLSCIKNYSNYLNSHTVLAFLKYQKKKAQNNLEKFEIEKAKINDYLYEQQQRSIQQTENIDWLSIFEKIDTEIKNQPNCYIIDNIEQKKNYFSEASFSLTIQYLTHFKKETCYFTPRRKIDYINSLKIVKPNSGKSESALFNQTVFEAQRNYYEFLLDYKTYLEFGQQTQTETKTEQHSIIIKPTLKPVIVEHLFEIIKDFFSPEQQNELKHLLETWDNVSNKLLFRDNGNRLSDTFKKLLEHDLITGCLKHDLINWIISNFSYIYRSEIKAFIYDTVEKTISRNDNPCKSPLIEIKNGQMQKVEKPRTKKYSKH